MQYWKKEAKKNSYVVLAINKRNQTKTFSSSFNFGEPVASSLLTYTSKLPVGKEKDSLAFSSFLP